MRVVRIGNSDGAICPVAECGKPAHAYTTDALAGYVDTCRDHASDALADALDEQASEWSDTGAPGAYSGDF